MKSSLFSSAFVWAILVLALAAVNFAVGWACMLFAVPPGYATTVFPPAGIALGAVLLFGYRVWPGVLLGALALSYTLAGPEGANLAVAFGIGAGSTLQALVGGWLIRRVLKFTASLDDEYAIGGFLLLGGPVACVTSASIGILTLSLAGNIADDFAYNWFTWWIGDSIGVMLFAPLLMVAFGKPREAWRPRWWSVGVSVLMAFLVVVGLSSYIQSHAEAEQRLEFISRTDTIHSAVATTAEGYLETVRSINGIYYASKLVERFEFRLFVERPLSRQSGISALAWIPRITREERDTFVQETRREASAQTDLALRAGLEAYALKEFHPPDEWKPYGENTEDEYYPVHFIEPYEGNEQALGINLASNAARRAALHSARDLDTLVCTAPIVLAQETGEDMAVLLIVPIHERGKPRETIQDRRDYLLGYASGVVRIREVVLEACSPAELTMVELSIVDLAVSPPNQQTLFGKSPDDTAKQASREQLRLQRTVDLEVGTRTWQLQFTPSPQFLSTLGGRRAWVESVLVLLFSFAVSGSTLLVTGRQRQVEKLVKERSEQLRLARFAMDHAADSIFWVNDQGGFYDANQTACESHGYSREELLAMSVWEVNPDYPKDKWEQDRARLRTAGQLVFESRHQTKDGRVFPVEVATGYIEFEGEGYFCAIVRDITERKEAIEALKSDEQLLRRLLETQEKERRIVAHDIHDGFVQYVIGAHFQLQSVDDNSETSAVMTALQTTGTLLKKAIAEGRRMIRDLRPMVLDEAGLVEAIRHLIEDEQASAGLTVGFDHQVTFARLESKLEGIIFRIIQEALTNVRKHGKTDYASVQLKQHDDMLDVIVRDHGVGFDRSEVSNQCFGLRGIRERARLFNGTAHIESIPGDGTIVFVRFQLDAQSLRDEADGVFVP